MIDPGVNGLVVPPRDPAALLQGLVRAAGFGPEAGRAARTWTEEHASRVDHMNRLQDIFAEVGA
jgi:hypothetical protein